MMIKLFIYVLVFMTRIFSDKQVLLYFFYIIAQNYSTCGYKMSSLQCVVFNMLVL